MHITTFASGSGGNAALVSSEGTHILIDAGISMRRISAALSEVGLSPQNISGVLITHEHSDHVCGVATMTKNHGIPIYAPRAVANYLRRSVAGIENCLNEIGVGDAFGIGGATVCAFHTPHDVPESVGYRIGMDIEFGFCTDLGHVTDEVLEALFGVDVALIESNHDEEMLRMGSYPYFLKRRILSDCGHLSNRCCGEFAAKLVSSGAKNIILGHLSRENNLPSLALQTVNGVLHENGLSGEDRANVTVAPQSGLCSMHIFEDAGSCLA